MKKEFIPDLKAHQPVEKNLSRREKRRVAQKSNASLPGNNKKNTPGRAIIQEEIGHFITVGDEPRSIEVLRMSRGKGGKKTYVSARMMLSRAIIAEYAEKSRNADGLMQLNKLPFVGRIVVGEDDSIKNAFLQVLVKANGRTENNR